MKNTMQIGAELGLTAQEIKEAVARASHGRPIMERERAVMNLTGMDIDQVRIGMALMATHVWKQARAAA